MKENFRSKNIIQENLHKKMPPSFVNKGGGIHIN